LTKAHGCATATSEFMSCCGGTAGWSTISGSIDCTARMVWASGSNVPLACQAANRQRQPAGARPKGRAGRYRRRPMRDRSPGRHRMAGRRERGKGGGDDAAAGSAGAVAPVFVPRAGSAHNSVVAASMAAAMIVASIGPSRSSKAATVRCHCDRAGPNATRIVSSRSNRMARGNFMRSST